MREREDVNRTREAGNRDEVEGVGANTLNLFRNGDSLLANTFGVGSSDWLGLFAECITRKCRTIVLCLQQEHLRVSRP